MYATLPVTGEFVDEFFTVIVVPVIVFASIASLKVMFTGVFGATPVAPPDGVTPVTVGAMLSTVPNVHEYGPASAVPDTFFAPVVMVAV